MIKRLGVASMGVAGMAYIFGPFGTMLGFMVLVGGPVGWAAYLSHTERKYATLPKNE